MPQLPHAWPRSSAPGRVLAAAGYVLCPGLWGVRGDAHACATPKRFSILKAEEPLYSALALQIVTSRNPPLQELRDAFGASSFVFCVAVR